MSEWADNFFRIPDAINENEQLRNKTTELVNNEPIHGKVTEGGNRKESLREILKGFFFGESSLEEATSEVTLELPRRTSSHAHNNRVFPDGWEDRLVRTQASRFYNQAVLSILVEDGDEYCYVPHSSDENLESACTVHLAGGQAEVGVLLERLERAHGEGNWHDEVMIPDHPHCTHTIVPLSNV